MLSVISQFESGREEEVVTAYGQVALICGHLLKNGWLKRNINYPSLKSIYFTATGEDMFKGWTICIINIMNQSSLRKSKVIVQCEVKGMKEAFLVKEFNLDLPDGRLLSELDCSLASLMALARQDALKLRKSANN